MRHVPSGASGGRGLNGLIFSFTRKFHETSVTRSRTTGKAFIGSMVTGWSSGKSFIRVMHISRGIPLTSAEQEPHLPALQFQRQARSLACSAWILCTASSTTMPSETSVLYSANFPPASPRQIMKVAVFIVKPFNESFHFLDDLLQFGRHLRQRLALDLHRPVRALMDDHARPADRGVLVGE